MRSDITTPAMAFPVRYVNGEIVTVEQDSTEHISGCVELTARTPVDTRPDLLPFGVPQVEFSQTPIDLQPFIDAINEWEDRAQISVRDISDAQDMDDLISRITISVREDGQGDV